MNCACTDLPCCEHRCAFVENGKRCTAPAFENDYCNSRKHRVHYNEHAKREQLTLAGVPFEVIESHG